MLMALTSSSTERLDTMHLGFLHHGSERVSASRRGCGKAAKQPAFPQVGDAQLSPPGARLRRLVVVAVALDKPAQCPFRNTAPVLLSTSNSIKPLRRDPASELFFAEACQGS